MQNFEYKAVPAPNRGTKAKGVKSTEDRFALSMTELLNEMAEDGWEYQRAETLPCDVRKGIAGRQSLEQHVLIFRRSLKKPEPLKLDDPSEPVAKESAPSLTERPKLVTAPPPQPDVDSENADFEPSEPVAPRRVSTRLLDEGSAPSVGSAEKD